MVGVMCACVRMRDESRRMSLSRLEQTATARHATFGGASPQPDRHFHMLCSAHLDSSGCDLSFSPRYANQHPVSLLDVSKKAMRHWTWQFLAASATRQTRNTNAQYAS